MVVIPFFYIFFTYILLYTQASSFLFEISQYNIFFNKKFIILNSIYVKRCPKSKPVIKH